MAIQSIEPSTNNKANQLCQEGLDYYALWDIERAITTFQTAISYNNQVADYFLYLAQAYVRVGDYENMRKALGSFIHLEEDQSVTERFEILFGNAMDEVETCLTQTMTHHDVPLEVIGAALQMWLEYRVTIGRKNTDITAVHAKEWASALDYTIRKVNFHEASVDHISSWYQISAQPIREKSALLIEALDVMPCDYRYFRGTDNPLDRLVEAANMLEELEERFYRP